MQRRHFKAIAAALNAVRPATDSQDYYMWARTVARFTKMCASQNPNFKRDRFLAACGKKFLKEQQSELYSQSWCETQGDNH
jgi:hypothetical protein